MSLRALARSVPNGFSMITRERSESPQVVEHLDHVGGRGRRHAEVVEQAASPAPSAASALSTAAFNPAGAARVRHVGEPAGELVPLLPAEGVAGELPAGLFGDRPELGVADLLHRDPDHPELRHQPRLEQPQQPRQQLAPGEIAGSAEDDYRLRGNVQATSLASAPRELPFRVDSGAAEWLFSPQPRFWGYLCCTAEGKFRVCMMPSRMLMSSTMSCRPAHSAWSLTSRASSTVRCALQISGRSRASLAYSRCVSA